MGRLLAWVSGAAGGVAAYKLLTRRRPGAGVLPAPAAPPEPAAPDPRAEALRAKLEERPVESPPAQEELPAETETPRPQPPEDPDARRRRVHEQGRAAAERMRRASGS